MGRCSVCAALCVLFFPCNSVSCGATSFLLAYSTLGAPRTALKWRAAASQSVAVASRVPEMQPSEGTEPADGRGRPSHLRHRHACGITTVRIRARNTGCQSRSSVSCGATSFLLAYSTLGAPRTALKWRAAASQSVAVASRVPGISLLHRASLSPRVSQPTLTICKRNSWCNDIASNGRTTPMTLRGGKDSANGSQGANSIASIFSSGEAQLLIVAALYGSLTVSFRLLYGTEGPPVPSMASLVRGIIAAACFVPSIMKKPTTEEESKGRGASLFLAALELSWWNAGAQGLQNAGLVFTEASRASFLTQTSVVLTPILSLLFGEKVGGNVWGACVLALFGVVTISRAESPAAAAAAAAHASAGINIGDLLCLAGAACWSMYILRLTQMMQSGKHCATALQAYKTCLLAGWYAVWVAYDAATVVGGMSSLWPGAASLLPLAIICYSAIGPGAVADVMQSRAQEKVKASQANVMLSAEPLMAALLGMLLLGERLSVSAGVGGLAIVVASLLASRVR